MGEDTSLEVISFQGYVVDHFMSTLHNLGASESREPKLRKCLYRMYKWLGIGGTHI